MDDELVRELDAAGFAFAHASSTPACKLTRNVIAVGGGSSYREPSLSELIERCLVFCRLSYESESDKWYAEGSRFMGEGEGPEEAVARLWLQLNNHTA